MPTLKRNVTGVEERKALGPYEGPEPRPGVYRCVIFSNDLRTAERSGNNYINVGVRLDTDAEPRNQFNGYVSWVIITLSEVEANLSREKAYYKSLGLSTDEPVIDYDKETRRIKKIGGVDPIGHRVMVQLKFENNSDPQYGTQLKGDTIYADPKAEQNGSSEPAEAAPAPAARRTRKAAAAAPAAEPAGAPADDVTAEAEAAPVANVPDFHSMSLPALKGFARSNGVDATGSKAEILDALDKKFGKADDLPPTDQDLLEYGDDEFWAFAKSKYAEGDIDGTEEKGEIIALLVADGYALEATAF